MGFWDRLDKLDSWYEKINPGYWAAKKVVEYSPAGIVGKAVADHVKKRHLEDSLANAEQSSAPPPIPPQPHDASAPQTGVAQPPKVAPVRPPSELEPIVTPCPLLFCQYDVELNLRGQSPKGVPSGTVMRPAFDPGASNHEAGPDKKPASDDTWQASACHPTVLTMIAQWLMTHPRTKQGLSLKGGLALPPEEEQRPVHWAKRLWDPTGNPKMQSYTTAGHPPWLPHVRNGSKNEWLIAHTELSLEYCQQLRRPRANGEADDFAPGEQGAAEEKGAESEDDPPRLRWTTERYMRPRRKDDGTPGTLPDEEAQKMIKSLARLIYRHGPLALNIAVPEHFVLLYGVRGRFFYILDPGREIVKRWGGPHVDGTPSREFEVAAPAGSDEKFVFQCIRGFDGCNVVIDVLYAFSNVLVKKGVHEERRFIDQLILAEGYSFPSCRNFVEFTAAEAPDGRKPYGKVT